MRGCSITGDLQPEGQGSAPCGAVCIGSCGRRNHRMLSDSATRRGRAARQLRVSTMGHGRSFTLSFVSSTLHLHHERDASMAWSRNQQGHGAMVCEVAYKAGLSLAVERGGSAGAQGRCGCWEAVAGQD